jgi:hypothetical protein
MLSFMVRLSRQTLEPARCKIEPSARLCGGRRLGYLGRMGVFMSAMFEEMGARRRRLRAVLGDRGQALVEFLVLGGLVLGSLGLFARPWMPAAAPWGFWLPLVFLVGYFLIEARRQIALRRSANPESISAGYDWMVLLWSFGCSLAGAAAFVIALSAKPAEYWTPPPDTPSVEIMSP